MKNKELLAGISAIFVLFLEKRWSQTFGAHAGSGAAAAFASSSGTLGDADETRLAGAESAGADADWPAVDGCCAAIGFASAVESAARLM